MPEPNFLVPRETGVRVVLAEPDSSWAQQYAVEEAQIRHALDDALREVHHAGSTSVPGLAAKPIIDIVLTVADSADEAAYVQKLESVGYGFHLREPQWHEHRLFKKGTPHFAPDRPEGEPRVNLHVFPAGCEEVRRMLAFRDWLRSNADDRQLYEDAKRRLSGRQWAVGQDYADAKTEVVAEIMVRALQAADQSSKGEGSPAPTRTTSG